MVLVIDSPPFLRPVRPHAWALYTDVLQEWMFRDIWPWFTREGMTTR